MESLSFGEASAQRILSLSICSCSKCSLKEHICFIEILQQILFCYCEGQDWDFRELLFSKASSAKLPSTCSFLELFPSTMLPATSPSASLLPSLSWSLSTSLLYCRARMGNFDRARLSGGVSADTGFTTDQQPVMPSYFLCHIIYFLSGYSWTAQTSA